MNIILDLYGMNVLSERLIPFSTAFLLDIHTSEKISYLNAFQ